jgi:DNA polymerase-3 subunit delta'
MGLVQHMSEITYDTALLPWQQTPFNRLHALWSNARLPHAWLLTGLPGVGKLEFALHLARHLLCRQATAQGPCGACQDCHLFRVGSHPDWLLLQPETRQLKIEQIRDAIAFAQNTSQRGGAKVIILEPAEAMNLNAANALLKILEEPPAGTFLLLISAQPGLLLPTLRSRCQQLDFLVPDAAAALPWLLEKGCPPDQTEALLHKARGAPLHALAMLQRNDDAAYASLLQNLQAVVQGQLNPVQAAKSCDGIELRACIDYQLTNTADLIESLQSQTTPRESALHALVDEWRTRLTGQAGIALIRRLHGLYHSLLSARKVALATNNANPQLILESLFVEWSTLASRQAR